MAGSHNEIEMDKILQNYDLENREIFYDLAYKTEELEKAYIKLDELKKNNFELQATLETLKNNKVDLETKLNNTSKRFATLSMMASRERTPTDGSTKADILILENKSCKEMLYKLQKEKDELIQINSRNDAKYKCILLNNDDLIKERNALRENVELLTKAITIKNKENGDLLLVKENILKLDRKIKESTFYITEINKLKKLNSKQQEDITYYRAYTDQLKDIISDIKLQKNLNPSPSETVKPHYEYCAEEIESLKGNLIEKLENERKSNKLLIKMDNLMRNKYNIAKHELQTLNDKTKNIEIALKELSSKYKTTTIELEEIDNKYRIAKIDLEKKNDKTFIDIETQTEVIKDEQNVMIDFYK